MRIAVLLSSLELAAHVGGLSYGGATLLAALLTVTVVAVGLFAVSSRPLPQQDWLLLGSALVLLSVAALLSVIHTRAAISDVYRWWAVAVWR